MAIEGTAISTWLMMPNEQNYIGNNLDCVIRGGPLDSSSLIAGPTGLAAKLCAGD